MLYNTLSVRSAQFRQKIILISSCFDRKWWNSIHLFLHANKPVNWLGVHTLIGKLFQIFWQLRMERIHCMIGGGCWLRFKWLEFPWDAQNVSGCVGETSKNYLPVIFLIPRESCNHSFVFFIVYAFHVNFHQSMFTAQTFLQCKYRSQIPVHGVWRRGQEKSGSRAFWFAQPW